MDPTPANVPHVVKALAIFGAPTAEITASDFATPGVAFQIGVPPGCIDVLTELTDSHSTKDGDPGLTVDFTGRDAFIRNKRATGRAKDLGDIDGL